MLIKCQRDLLGKQLVQLHCDGRRGVERARLSDAHYAWTHTYCYRKVGGLMSCGQWRSSMGRWSGRTWWRTNTLIKVKDGFKAANDPSKLPVVYVLSVLFPSGHVGDRSDK